MSSYTMTVTDVQAWQVAPDGSIPDGARRYVETHRGEWSARRNAWVWFSDILPGYAYAHPGDWIVAHEYGLEAFRDDYFHEVCTPDEGGDA